MSEKEYEGHCDRIRDSACWGGEPEVCFSSCSSPSIPKDYTYSSHGFSSCWAITLQILALSKALKYPIHVVQAFHPTIKVSDEFLPLRGNMALTISYHRKSYGLGEHYNCMFSFGPSLSISPTCSSFFSFALFRPLVRHSFTSHLLMPYRVRESTLSFLPFFLLSSLHSFPSIPPIGG